MQVWEILYFAFTLVTAIGCITLVMAEWHITERAEEQAWKELRKKIAAIR